MAALGDFIKKNASSNSAGKIGKGFIAFDIANLVTSENKLKALLQLFKDLILLKPILHTAFAGLFLAMGRSIRSLVHDTGSLEAALKKLSQIQGLRNMFAPLVGGAAAAKLKVAELVNFAASRKINLGDAAQAARSLQIMTRGSFSGAQALDVVLDASKATGNGFVNMADAVGQFSAELRSGGSIDGAVEQLRQMGAITDATADSLMQLQRNGASAGQVFSTLTSSLAVFREGAQGTADDIDSINTAYETAAANLQEKFASPFVQSDIQNTKNMTDAMNGVAPAVERVSGVLAVLFNAFSTTKSWMAKTAGESPAVRTALEGLVYVITGLVTVASALGAIALGTWLVGLGLASTAAATGIASAALGLTILTGGLGVFIAIAAVAVGIGLQMGAAAERAAKAINDLAQAHNQANSAIEKQIRSVRTLTDRHDVLAKSMDAVTAAQLELNKAREEGDDAKIAENEANLAIAQKNARRAQRINPAGLEPGGAEQQAVRDQVQRQREQREMFRQNQLDAASPERQAAILAARAADAREKAAQGAASEKARIEVEQQGDQTAFGVTAAEKRLQAAQARAAGAKSAADRGNVPVMAGGLEGTPEAEAALAEQTNATKELEEAQLALAAALKARAEVGSNAPAGTSVGLEFAQRQMLAGNDPEKAKKAAALGLEAERARQIEANRGEYEATAIRDTAQRKAIQRELMLGNERAKTEKAIADIKEFGFERSDKEAQLRLNLLDKEEAAERSREGGGSKEALTRIAAQREDIKRSRLIAREQFEATKLGVQLDLAMQAAILKGNSKGQQAIGDLSVFTDKFQQLVSQGFEVPEAKKLAGQFADNSIALSTQNTGAVGQVADSLARIGGGGGVGGPSGDPMLSIGQRQVQLHEAELEYLRKIAEAGNKGVL